MNIQNFTVFFANTTTGISGLDTLSLFKDLGFFALLIIIALALFSVGSWGIIITKIRLFKRARRESAELYSLLKRGGSFKELHEMAVHSKKSYFAPMLKAALKKRGKVSVELREIMEREGSQTIGVFENKLVFLATTGNVCPFVGLLGTVWGVMRAFADMGFYGTSNITIVAPGIAEALITTVAGLLVAIPAVIAYNYFLSQVRAISREMDVFISETCEIIGSSK
jgi:biopolymer transport protein TolQ